MNRNRLILLAAAGAIAVVVVVVVIVLAAGGGGGGTETTTEAAATPDAASPRALFAGIPQHGDVLGRAGAPTLLVFEDPQCPFCRQWNLDALPAVVSEFVRPGRLQLAFRGIDIIGPNSVEGLRALEAAGRQGKLWQVADALYRRQGEENSGWITPALIREAALDAGADPAKIVAAMPSTTEALAANEREATELGLRGTPSFYLVRPPAPPRQLQVTALDASTFTAALADALQ